MDFSEIKIRLEKNVVDRVESLAIIKRRKMSHRMIAAARQSWNALMKPEADDLGGGLSVSSNFSFGRVVSVQTLETADRIHPPLQCAVWRPLVGAGKGK